MTDRYAAVHANPQGPGDARPKALDIVNDEDLQQKWTDKVIFITGCSSGIGVEAAKALSTTGAQLYLTARDLNKAKAALGDLAQSDRVHLLELDLESLDSVRTCAKTFLSQTQQLNVLICNAGVMATPEGRTKDGFETQLGTNHLAHFLLINLLVDTLRSSSQANFASRIVILASVAHRFGSVHFDNLNLENGAYDANVAYSQSKTANIWTANELERRYGGQGVHTWSLQPGGIATPLMKHMSEDSKDAVKQDPQLAKIFKSPEQGASTTVWAATASCLEGKGGDYLEDCQIIGPWEESRGMWGTGYGAHAFDPSNEARLWAVSEKLVGLKQT